MLIGLAAPGESITVVPLFGDCIPAVRQSLAARGRIWPDSIPQNACGVECACEERAKVAPHRQSDEALNPLSDEAFKPA